MKKRVLSILFFITLFFIGNNNVFAELKCEVGEEKCTMEAIVADINKTYAKSRIACLYEVEVSNKKYYNYIFYSEAQNKIYAGTTLGMFGGYKELKSDENAYLLGSAYDGLYNKNQCPLNSYLNDDSSLDLTVNKVCFDNNGECKNNGQDLDGNDFNITQSSNLAGSFSEALKYKSLTYKNSCDNTYLPEDYDKACRYIDSDTGNYILLLYNNNNNQLIFNNLKLGVRFVIDEGQTKFGNQTYVEGIEYSDDYTNKISSPITSCPNNIYMNEYDAQGQNGSIRYGTSYTFELNSAFKTTKYKLYNCSDNSTTPQETPYDSCEQLIDGNLREIIEEIMNIIRIIVPIMLIGLITYDFSMAVLSGVDDKVNKIKKRTIQRIVIAIVIFFVPTFINLIFNMVNDVWGTEFSTCGITESK